MKIERADEEDTVVSLDLYNSDLNLVIDASRYSAHPLTSEGFAFMWAGARATYGVNKGKICYEMKVIKHLDVSHLPSDEPNPHVIRIGFSVEDSTLQLGEDPLSYGYGGTGKMSTNCQFKDYGTTFMEGDSVMAILNMDSDPVQMGFSKNGKFLGWAYKIMKPQLQGKALYPHVLTKNCSFEINFGQKDRPFFPLPDGFKDFTFIGCVPLDVRVRGTKAPEKREDCEMIMMCGLPGAGKSVWAADYSSKNPRKKYNLLGTNNIIDKMKVMGLPRKRNYSGRWDVLIKMATKCLNKMFEIGSKLRRNYILDQTNVYPTAQRRKMRNFEGFKRKAVVVVPTEDEFKRRCDKRDREEGKEIPDSAILEMKANFKLPEVCDIFDEVIYTEEKREASEKLVHKYNEEGRAAMGPNKKQFRPQDQQPGFGGGRGNFDSNRSGSFDSNRSGPGSPSRGGYNNRGGFEGRRGGFEGGRGGFGGGRGGFGGGRGGSEGGRGNYDSGRGNYDGSRGKFEGGRGNFEGGRGGYGGNRGGYGGNPGGYGGNPGGYGGNPGGYGSNQGGYGSNQGGFDGSSRGNTDSGYGSNRGGYMGTRGSQEQSFETQDSYGGSSGYDSQSSHGTGYGSSAGYGNNSPSSYNSRGSSRGSYSSRGDFGRGSSSQSSYGRDLGYGSDSTSGGQYSDSSYTKEPALGAYDKGGYSSRNTRGYRGSSSRGGPRGGGTRGNNSSGSYRGGYAGSDYGNADYDRNTGYQRGGRDGTSSNYGYTSGGQGAYGDKSQSMYRGSSENFDRSSSGGYGSGLQGNIKKEPGTYSGRGSQDGSNRSGRGGRGRQGATRWSAETPQSFPQDSGTGLQETNTYSGYSAPVKTEPADNSATSRYDTYSAQTTTYGSYDQSGASNTGYQGAQSSYRYPQGQTSAPQQWAAADTTSYAASTPAATDQQQWSQYYQPQQQAQTNQYYNPNWV